MFTGCYLASSPLPGAGGGGSEGGGDTQVTFSTSNPPTQNGSATVTTTAITFTLSEAIAGLTAGDITLSGVAGVTKGTLSGAGPTYTLPISGFTAGGTLTITVTKTGYTISGSQTVTIFYYTISIPEYDLGDTGPGGGIIVYHDPAGFTVQMADPAQNYTAYYLEAAPNDMATGLIWASATYVSTDITGTATDIGTGRKNTAVILTADANAPAAKACDTYSNGGKTDWFLPSKDELNQLYLNRASVGNMGTNTYLSSSQGSIYYAWGQRFSDGDQSGSSKNNNTYSVRAVRAF